MQQISYRKVEFTTEKETTLDCRKVIPTRGRISCESSGNLYGRHESTLTQLCLHEKSSRKEMDVWCQPCQILVALKHFGLTKKIAKNRL